MCHDLLRFGLCFGDLCEDQMNLSILLFLVFSPPPPHQSLRWFNQAWKHPINPHTPSDDDARQRVWTGYGASLCGAAMARPDAIPRIENKSGWRLNTSCNVVHVYITRPLCDCVNDSKRRMKRERQPPLSMCNPLQLVK